MTVRDLTYHQIKMMTKDLATVYPLDITKEVVAETLYQLSKEYTKFDSIDSLKEDIKKQIKKEMYVIYDLKKRRSKKDFSNDKF